MKTVGNDAVRDQLHENRKWYLGLGIILILFGVILFASLPFATLSMVFLFGILMMLGGAAHIIAGFKLFSGGFRILWLLFAVLYFVAGYYAFSTPVETAVVLTNLIAIFLLIAGVIRIFNAVLFRAVLGWGWVLLSGVITALAGVVILTSSTAPFWVLGMFLAMDILFQGINYLRLASYIKYDVPPSSTTIN